MSATEITLAYLSALASVVSRLRCAIPWVGRVGEPGVLMARTVDGDYVRGGTVPGVGEFWLHGVGCLVEFLDGALVDFDWDSSGREVFDPWRIRRFGRSVGVKRLDEDELLGACRDLVNEGRLVEVSEGRFACV